MIANAEPPQVKISEKYYMEYFNRDNVCPPSAFVRENGSDRVYECKYDATARIPFYEIKDENDSTLVFESRFESGNLACADKM
jgi:hypothetical protein